MLYIEKGGLERAGHNLVLQQGSQETILPVGISSCILVGPGVSTSHAAVALCAEEGALLLWVGEHGVRLYSAGNPRGRSKAILEQAITFADPQRRLKIAREIYARMFNEPAPLNRSIEQLRGLEGAKVKSLYIEMANRTGVEWTGKKSDLNKDPLTAALAGVNAALYGVTEAAILALGYSPSIGFVHTGDPRSFVFDIADTIKFQTSVPLAFALAKEGGANMEHRSRTAMRDLFFREKLAEKIVSSIESLFDADGRG